MNTADKALRPTDGKENFVRLTWLLMRGGEALLREVFDVIHPPPTLPAVLDANKDYLETLLTANGYKVFHHFELKCLYGPSGRRKYGKSTDFDVSLLCKLLRAIGRLNPPATGWDKLPDSRDLGPVADLVRIWVYRNTIHAHNRSMEITNTDFAELWNEISGALLRIAGRLRKKVEWEKSIDDFSRDPLTPDAKKCVDELRSWYLIDMQTKDMVELMEIRNKQRHMEILIAIDRLEANVSVASSSPQVESAQLPSERLETRIPIPPEQPPLQALRQQQAALDFWNVLHSLKNLLNLLISYLEKKFGADVSYRYGSLILTVSCSSLEVLEALWKEYRTGHLNKVVQEALVTAEVLEKVGLREVQLRTFISEEDYLSYKDFLNYRQGETETKTSQEPAVFGSKLPAGKGKMIIPQVLGSPAMELVEGKTETKSSQEPAVFASKLPAGKIVSTTSVTEPTTAELLAGPTHGKPSQVVKGGYIARSGYVLILNNCPIPRGPFELERIREKGVFAAEFGFTTREDIGLTTSDMLKALTDTAQRDFSSNDCFCCIIRSTGTEHGICGTDDKPIDIKTITSLFTSDKCPSLDGKPKIFVLEPEYRSRAVSLLEYEADIEARSMLRHLVISEKDFLVWNLFASVPRFHVPFLFGADWLGRLLKGMHLRKAIAAVTGGNEQPLSLLSTLEKNVFFEPNTAV